MKTKMTRRGEWRVTSDEKETSAANFRHPFAFTLVELLTVIAIIAILAAMLLPVLSAAKVHGQKTQARLQIQDLVQEIQNYDSQYSRMPIPAAAQAAAPGSNYFTFGGGGIQIPGGPWTPPGIGYNYFPSNSDIVAILMDLTNYPGGGPIAANANYQKNPQQTVFLNAKLVASTNLPGVGPDLNYRDPWGTPYVITMDVSDDNLCRDPFYSSSIVGAGGGLIEQSDGSYACHGNVMVWSAGPLVGGKPMVDPNSPADQGVNKNHIVSWQ